MRKIYFFYTVLLIALVSCNDNTKMGILCEVPANEIIHINPGVMLECNLDSTQYDIVDVIELQLPNEIPSIGTYAPIINDSTIVFLDEVVSKKVLSFDMSGKFLGELGRIGHAKNEYFKTPNSISFDKEGYVHAFSQPSMKILKYDRYGKCLDIHKIKYHPIGATVVGKGKYLFAFNTPDKDHKSRLCVYNSLENNMSALMNLPEEEHGISYTFPFTQNKNETFFVPLLTDSVIAFEGEKVKKIIHLDFNGKFLPKEVRDDAFNGGGLEVVYNYQGVNFVNRFAASDKYYFVEYGYTADKKRTENWASLIDRNSGKIIFNTPYGFLKGVNPYNTYFIYNDYIYFIADEEKVKQMNEDYNPEYYPELWKCVPLPMRKIMNGVTKLPALVKIRLK